MNNVNFYYEENDFKLIKGDTFKVLKCIEPKSIDMIFADPPYFLSNNGLTFIWFTDGIGWNSAKKNLEERFNEFETIYNIDDLENGILERI